MSEIAIRVEGIGKKYKIGRKKSGEFRESFSHLWERIKQGKNNSSQETQDSDFWALKDISFEVKKGEAVGIIGRNGAGKSTLLKVLSRITKPTTGRFEINGRVSSLLEVGTGFHPELTGRENIYLNGTILGMRRAEIKSKFDEIIAFSGVEEFLDTPVKHYSSGMKVRLAFSVAAHLEPEILIIDEVLAVGDAEFQKKCLGKMEDVTGEGRTVLFVSHNMAAVKSLCIYGLLLDKGRLVEKANTNEIIDLYIKKNRDGLQHLLYERIDRLGSGELKFSQVKIHDLEGNEISDPVSGSGIRITTHYILNQKLKDVIFRLQVTSDDDYILFTLNNFHSDKPFKELNDSGYVTCEIDNLPLNENTYYVNLQCLAGREVIDEINSAFRFSVLKGDFFGTGKLPAVKQGILLKHKWILNDE